MGRMKCSTEYRWREDTTLLGNLQEHREKSVLITSIYAHMCTHAHTHKERERRVCTCMYRCTHTAQSTLVFVEIQVVQSVLMVGRKETERQVDLQGDGQHCPWGEPT